MSRRSKPYPVELRERAVRMVFEHQGEYPSQWKPMARPSTGQVIEREGKRGPTYATRFRAYGRRHYLTLGSAEDGWNRARAEEELQNVLADVRRGIWRPHEPDPAAAADPTTPNFHTFASEFCARHEHEWRERTREHWHGVLSHHLLPRFARKPIDRITVADVEAFKTARLREREQQLVERPLSNGWINRIVSMLATILDEAIEFEIMAGPNPARGKRRKLKAERPRRSWLTLEQAHALLEHAGKDRAFIATAMLGGLRVGETLALCWRDVSLGSGALRVRESKTDAGTRTAELSPTLVEALAERKARSRFAADGDFVFPTRRGTRQDRRNASKRILAPAVGRANEALAKAGHPQIEHCSMHTLRRTCISLMLEAGAPVPLVMRQVGHTQPQVTLGIYAAVIDRQRDTGERLDALVRGASLGTSAQSMEQAEELLQSLGSGKTAP